MDLSTFVKAYEELLYNVAAIVADTLQFIGIFIILAGTLRALFRLVHRLRSRESFNVVIDLGRALSLALECKMGAEIIHTVIVRNLEELGILAVVILIRALLALIIHWEIRMEQQHTKEPDSPAESQEEPQPKDKP